MRVAKRVFNFILFLVFALILILSTSTASIFVKNLFTGEGMFLASFCLLHTSLREQ